MSDQNPATTPLTTQGNGGFPLPAIICIAIGAYIVVIVALLILRQLLMKRGVLGGTTCCGKEGDPCCECCIACGESCNCCGSPNLEGCLDSICPTRRKTECADVVQCRCCTDPEQGCSTCCGGDEPLCDCGNCNCQCQPPACEECNCFCFTCQLKDPAPPMQEDY